MNKKFFQLRYEDMIINRSTLNFLRSINLINNLNIFVSQRIMCVKVMKNNHLKEAKKQYRKREVDVKVELKEY